MRISLDCTPPFLVGAAVVGDTIQFGLRAVVRGLPATPSNHACVHTWIVIGQKRQAVGQAGPLPTGREGIDPFFGRRSRSGQVSRAAGQIGPGNVELACSGPASTGQFTHPGRAGNGADHLHLESPRQVGAEFPSAGQRAERRLPVGQDRLPLDKHCGPGRFDASERDGNLIAPVDPRRTDQRDGLGQGRRTLRIGRTVA